MKYEVKKVLSKKVLCDCCGEEHSISEMSPVFAKVNGKFIETDRFLCKECLSEIDSLDGYAQCGDCKRAFLAYLRIAVLHYRSIKVNCYDHILVVRRVVTFRIILCYIRL